MVPKKHLLWGKPFKKKEWGCLVWRKMSLQWLNDYLWVNTRVTLFSRTTPFPGMEVRFQPRPVQLTGAPTEHLHASTPYLVSHEKLIFSLLRDREEIQNQGFLICPEVDMQKGQEWFRSWVLGGKSRVQAHKPSVSYRTSLILNFLISKIRIRMRASL